MKSRWVGVEELAVPAYYADLYPLPRDLSGLRRSFERHGFRPEYPLVVRTAAAAGAVFEIVCGVGRYTVARERGMLRVPAVVRRFGTENEARSYSIEDNLFGPSSASRLSLAQRIVLARALRERGVECTPRQIWESAGVSASTYWRAEKCLRESLGRALAEHPELGGLDTPRQVAEIVRRELDQYLARLLAGDVEVNTFRRSQNQEAREASSPAEVLAGEGEAREGGSEELAPAAPLARPDEPAGGATADGKDGKKQGAGGAVYLPLFDPEPSRETVANG